MKTLYQRKSQENVHREGREGARRKLLYSFVLFLALSMFGILPAHSVAQAQGSDTTILRVTLLDVDGQPIADAEINLILIRYSDTGVEQIPADTCHTDENGQCTFEIVDAPRLASGQAEAYLDVTGIARQLVSWSGDELDVVLKGDELTLGATLSAPLETGYDYTPDANEVLTATVETEMPTATPTATASPSPTPEPTDTPAPTASETTIPSTATPTPEPTSGKVGILPLACGLITFAALGILFWRKARNK